MRILITGGLGQLGKSLQETMASHELLVIDLPEYDITDGAAMIELFDAWSPDIVIHCAAFTDVDGSARNPELAFRVNAEGTRNVSLAVRKAGAVMVHLSTNEVFPGDDPAGYEEWRPLQPINVYGQSKATAEEYVRDICEHYYIVRTAWLYAPGGRNFIHAIIGRAVENGRLEVVVDEVGNPTYVRDLAEAIARLISSGQYGTYHFTNSGSCSRWAFAREILKLSELGHVPVAPILSRDYRRASTPPPYGALLNVNGADIGITLRPWREALAEYIDNFGN